MKEIKKKAKLQARPVRLKVATILVSLFLCILFSFFIYPFSFFSKTIIQSSIQSSQGEYQFLTAPFTGSLKHYIKVKIIATNTKKGSKFPEGVACIIWQGEKESPLYREKFKIFIDGISHLYYVPVGENYYWNNTDITLIKLEPPLVEGLVINIESFTLKERILFPLDTYVNFNVRRYLEIQSINRWLTPSYLLLLFITLLVSIFTFIQNIQKLYHKQNLYYKPLFLIQGLCLFVLLFFSFYFVTNEYFTGKSYYNAYKDYILEGNLSETYLGFYDFEKFLRWLDKKIPEDENIIVFLRGENTYIMSEMAYNLYPRDIKFINISEKEAPEILREISTINEEDDKDYKYVVILSGKDKIKSSVLTLVDSYKDSGGIIYLYEHNDDG